MHRLKEEGGEESRLQKKKKKDIGKEKSRSESIEEIEEENGGQ